MGPIATIARVLLVVLLGGGSTPAVVPPQAATDAPLLVVVTDAVTGAPLPEADVRWLPLTVHDAALAAVGFDGPREREAAVLRTGTQLTLDAEGHARIDAPLGGLIVLARTHDRYLMREVGSGASEVALALEVDLNLTVTILQTSGAPLVGATAGLWAGAVAHGSVAGSTQVLSATTDSSGALTLHRVQTMVPQLATFLARGDVPPPLHVELDVIGERVVFPLDAAALRARAATFTAPPLGVVAVRLLDVGTDGRRARQAVEVRDIEPERREQRGSQFTGAVDGVNRRSVRLGRRFEVRVRDPRVMGVLTAVVEGPRTEGEVVDVGPLIPDDHADLRIVTGVSLLDLPADGLIWVAPAGVSERGFAAMERVRFGQQDLGAEGELTLRVPLELFERPGAALRATLWFGGRERCAADVTGELAPGARLAAPLGALLAAARVGRPEAELLVDGVVVDVAGRPVPGAHITVMEDDPTQHSESFQLPLERSDAVVRTDTRGRFVLLHATDARRFRLQVGGAGFATPRVVLAERGARDLRVTLSNTMQLSARVTLDDDVDPERFVVDLVEHTDGVRSPVARRMRQVGRGEFIIETTDTGPAELRVHSRVTVTWSGQRPHVQELLVASLAIDLGDTPGAVDAPAIDLCGQLMRLDPRAVDAVSGAPLSDATYTVHLSPAEHGRTLVGVPVGEATYVPVGEVTLVVEAPGRIPAQGAPEQEEFALVEAPRSVFTVEVEPAAPPPGSSAEERPKATVDARPPSRAVVDLELLDEGGLPFARREVQARWLWPGARADHDAVGAWLLRTDVLGRVLLAAEGVPLEHEALELELVTDLTERPVLYERVLWRAREPRRSSSRPLEPWTTVASVGAVRLGTLEPAVTGRVLDRAGQPVVGARLVVADERQVPGAPRSASSWFDELRVTHCDSEGRFELYALSGSGPLMPRGVDLPDRSVRVAPGTETHLPRGSRDVVVTAERLATVVVVLALDEGVGPAHVEVALVRDDGDLCQISARSGGGGQHRYEFRGVLPGVYTQQVTVAASMTPHPRSEPTSRALYESTPTPLEWDASGPTVLPTIDLTEGLAVTQVSFVLDGTDVSLWHGAELERNLRITARGSAPVARSAVDGGDLWSRPRQPELGGFELLTCSRAPLALEVAGTALVRGAEGGYHPMVVRSEPVLVGAGVATAVVALEALPPLRLRVSQEIVEALAPYHLYAIAWRTAVDGAAQQSAPTASFGVFDASGELVLTAPEPRPGMGEATVEVELVLVSNLGEYPGDLAQALDFPRVRREAAFSRAISFPDGEVTPRHVPRAERLLELDAREQPTPWRRVVEPRAITPMQLDVTVAAVRAARTLLERE